MQDETLYYLRIGDLVPIKGIGQHQQRLDRYYQGLREVPISDRKPTWNKIANRRAGLVIYNVLLLSILGSIAFNLAKEGLEKLFQ